MTAASTGKGPAGRQRAPPLIPSEKAAAAAPSSKHGLARSRSGPRQSIGTPSRLENAPAHASSQKPVNGSAETAPSDGNRTRPINGVDESTETEEEDITNKIGFEPHGTRPLLDPQSLRKPAIVWLDIDNTLYKKSNRIADLMAERIRAYFLNMGLSEHESKALHQQYYSTYGLAIRGLVKHHQIDPLDYDKKCDASLPLENILRPDPQVIKMLSDIDRSQARVFALTNAYKDHANRVLRLLDLDDQVEGIVYCDYAVPDFSCKPELDYYKAAMKIVGAQPTTKCYFVDDSSLNIVAAKELGWYSCVYFKEDDELPPPSKQDQQAASAFDLSVLSPQANGVSPVSGFDEQAIKAQLQKLPSHMRIRLLSIILDACLPGDIASMARTLEKHLRMTRDVVSSLPDTVALKIFEKLPIQDLLRCRQVSKKWLSLAATPGLWRSHALALTENDPVKVESPADPSGWEPLVKGLFFRERNWAKGIAQKIDRFEGHTGFVTSIKLKGRKTLVTGSYDETIRVWDLSTGSCSKVLRAKAISCLDFLLEQGILCAGLYDSGRVMIWDMKTWELIQTLSGHNRGIRNVAINKDYLVSVGQDKAIVVWDWKTGAKIVRFGQQSNVSLGVSLVDTDKLVAVTVDGVIRCFSIKRKEMIGQFHLAKLGDPSLSLASRLGDLAAGSTMLEWFAAHGNTLTVASKNLVVHLEWQEHIVPLVDEAPPSPAADGLRRSASSRLGTGTPTPMRTRTRNDSLQSNSSAVGVGARSAGSTPARSRRDSTTSNASTASAATTAARRSLGGSVSRSPASTTKTGGPSEVPALSTPSRPSPGVKRMTPAISSRRISQPAPAPWPLPKANLAQTSPGPGPSPSTSTNPNAVAFPSEATPSQSPTATRIAPNLTAAPRVAAVLDTPDMATGCVDPSKRRIVCSTRFSSRAGADRQLYTSSLGTDFGQTLQQLQSGSGSESGSGVEPAANISPIVGAWSACAAELQTPSRNPMAMVLDHESVVVGCADGAVYRVGFVGSEYRLQQPHVDETEPASPVVGDATIKDLVELRRVWSELFLPEDAPADHPGRLKRDAVRALGLK